MSLSPCSSCAYPHIALGGQHQHIVQILRTRSGTCSSIVSMKSLLSRRRRSPQTRRSPLPYRYLTDLIQTGRLSAARRHHRQQGRMIVRGTFALDRLHDHAQQIAAKGEKRQRCHAQLEDFLHFARFLLHPAAASVVVVADFVPVCVRKAYKGI